jgi:CRP/FNR family cyclic AMP-dependent transcriptional regulator
MSKDLRNRNALFDFLRSREAGAQIHGLCDGQIIFQSSDRADNIFMVEAGEVRLLDTQSAGHPRLLEILGPGDLFGLSALGMLETYGKQAASCGDTTICAIPVVELRKSLLTHGELAVQFVELLALQVLELRVKGGAFRFGDTLIRLVQKLISFANSPAAHRTAAGVELHITQEQLAQAIGVARETVSHCLMGLRKRNLVETRRNRLIYDPQRLGELCHVAHEMPELILAG